MVSTAGVSYNLPWIDEEYRIRRIVPCKSRSRRLFCGEEYIADFSPVDPNNYNCTWKPGDIVQFYLGYGEYVLQKESWRSWFMKREDYLDYLERTYRRVQNIPLYARGEFGIVLTRYRWRKYKYKVYNDYGTIVMMLSGKKKGHVRKFYANIPFVLMCPYPYTGWEKSIPMYDRKIDEISYAFQLLKRVSNSPIPYLLDLYNYLGGDYEPRRSDRSLSKRKRV